MDRNLKALLPDDFWDWSLMERQEWLQGVADKVDEQEVEKPLSEQEKQDLNSKFSRNEVDLSRLEDQYQEVKDEWQEKLKPYKKKRKELLEKLKTGRELVNDMVFYIADHEADMMYGFTPDGTVVVKRRLYQEERQKHVGSDMRAVNNNENKAKEG